MRTHFARDQDGVSAVEFAITLPILLTIVMGAIEFGLIFFTYNAAGHASWDVARQLATNQITTSQVSALAVAELPSWVQSSASVLTQSSSSDPNTNHYTVTISFPATAGTPTKFLSWAYSTLTLKARTTMQQEPTS